MVGDESAGESKGLSTGGWLAFWMLVSLLLHVSPWLDGRRDRQLGLAIEDGAARAEQKLAGEVGEKEIREALGLQYDSIPFWKAAWGVGDLILAPLGVGLRVFVTAAALAAAAALTGRPPRFAQYGPVLAAVQGFWLLGMGLQLGCSLLWGWVPEISARLLLPPGQMMGAVWSIAGQLDPFGTLGWLVVAGIALQRRWVHPVTGLPMLFALAVMEPVMLGATEMTLQAAIRGTVLP